MPPLAPIDPNVWDGVQQTVSRRGGPVRRMRIDSYTIDGTGLQDRGRSAPAHGLENDGAVLVRPDGHAAWRRARGPAPDQADRRRSFSTRDDAPPG